MKLSAHLEFGMIAIEQTDELAVLVEITADAAPADRKRQPATLVYAADASGSMRGGRLDAAKSALLALVDRLDPDDNFGVVTFDDQVRVVVPAGPLTDKPRVKAALAAIQPGGMTDLSGGWFRALQEARRVLTPAGATVTIISDGKSNRGVTDTGRLEAVAAQHRTHGIVTSTLGIGLDYSPGLLDAMAAGGSGSARMAEEGDAAAAIIAGEVEGLLEQVAQASSLRVSWGTHVTGMDAMTSLPITGLPDGAMLELGSFHAGETRRLLLTFKVPGVAALGLVQVASLEFTHVALPDLVQHTTTVPVMVNVVPGDQAAGRVPDPKVRAEVLFQQAQRVKHESARLLSERRTAEATDLLGAAGAALRTGAAELPPAFTDELLAESHLLDALADESRIDDSRASKAAYADAAMKSRSRGRQRRGGLIVLRSTDGAQELVLQEWEHLRLVRLLPAALRQLLRPAPDPHGAAAAQAIADALGAAHPSHGFFAAAARGVGFRVGRA